ncbi:hypothetical protein NC651_017232 [Populus alba x Populus x berolinensis]|nr:hypothetical protein NC651_017232 [Populus alba x Populus x berolinensis]
MTRVPEITFGWQQEKTLENLIKFMLLAYIVGFGQQTTDPKEVDALNKLIAYWNLRDKLNITDDPLHPECNMGDEKANPRVACGLRRQHLPYHSSIYALDISGEIPSQLFVLQGADGHGRKKF